MRAVPIVAKKINLADSLRAWEHERFSMERLPAFTLSSHESPLRVVRRSMVDVVECVGNCSNS